MKSEGEQYASNYQLRLWGREYNPAVQEYQFKIGGLIVAPLTVVGWEELETQDA